MAVTMMEAVGEPGVVDLRGHRLGDLVRVLSGCDTASAELAVAGVRPGQALDQDEALDVLARAIVRVRRAEQRAAHGRRASDQGAA